MNLVVGATGQLGTAVVRQLAVEHQPVRAFVRRTSHYRHLEQSGAQLAFGDLRNPASIEKALDRVDVVLATANAIMPRGGGTQEEVEDTGYANLIAACKRARVQQFIFISVPPVEGAENVSMARFKALNEKRLIESGIPYTIFRGEMFMEVWLSLIGSRLPMRGEYASAPEHPFWFYDLFTKMVGTMIDDRGRAIIAGGPESHHTPISMHDVATFMVRAVCNEASYNRVINLGGPEVLTWEDIARIFGEVLGRPVKAMYTPPGVFRVMSAVMRPFAPHAADVLGLNYYGGLMDIAWDMSDTAKAFGVSHMKTVKELLTEKASLPAD